jgi:hypothetical protein
MLRNRLDEIPNPLKTLEVARGDVTVAGALTLETEGICPKCNSNMEHARLGKASGHQKVNYCVPCRVAYPVHN